MAIQYSGRGNTGTSYDSLIDTLRKEQEKANQANLQRYQQIMSLSDQLASIYAPGGAFGAGHEAQLGRAKEKDVSSGMQALVGSGLAGTTQAAGLGKKWEEEVGAPARLKLEDLRMGRYADALSQKMGYMERREDTGPSYDLIAQLAEKVGTAPQQSGWGKSRRPGVLGRRFLG